MIRVEVPAEGLTPAERYGLDTLIDLSGLLRVEDPAAPVVSLHLTPDPAPLADVITGFVVRGADGALRIPRAMLAHVTAIAGAGAEQASGQRDHHGRVPTSANPLVTAGADRLPIVSMWARALSKGAKLVAGNRVVRCVSPWPDRRRWAAAFTHDVDVMNGWPAFTALRLAELIRAGEGRRAGRVMAAAVRHAFRSPALDGINEVIRSEAARGVRATWFFLCGSPTLSRWMAGDVTYDVRSPRARQVMTFLDARQHEVGVHGTFATSADTSAFERERIRLAAATGGPGARGIRQHFLKMRPGVTQRPMREAGFAYDATYGFPDRNGFRLGVADIVAGWDAQDGQSTSLDEVPLHWMDRAQSKYQGIEDPQAWVADALELASQCKQVEGLWVGLWHPNLTPALGYPDAPAAYAELLGAIVEDPNRPHVDTLEQLVAWRRRRRAARARRVAGDGTVEWESPPVPLEDAEGRPID
ncbi:MAG TPA: hypothetical protein VN674_01210 [Gemmatimonadales bacterium]|nr:hypothetical protein [Gemmatimonadales bacterium]